MHSCVYILHVDTAWRKCFKRGCTCTYIMWSAYFCTCRFLWVFDTLRRTLYVCVHALSIARLSWWGILQCCALLLLQLCSTENTSMPIVTSILSLIDSKTYTEKCSVTRMYDLVTHNINCPKRRWNRGKWVNFMLLCPWYTSGALCSQFCVWNILLLVFHICFIFYLGYLQNNVFYFTC